MSAIMTMNKELAIIINILFFKFSKNSDGRLISFFFF